MPPTSPGVLATIRKAGLGSRLSSIPPSSTPATNRWRQFGSACRRRRLVMPDSIIDPFDPAALRIDQNTEALAVKRVWTTIPVGVPKKHHWFRVHPSEEFRLTKAATIKLEEGIERDIYILAPQIAAAFPEEVSYVALFTVINRQDQIRVWPIR